MMGSDKTHARFLVNGCTYDVCISVDRLLSAHAGKACGNPLVKCVSWFMTA
jgi:hypothetical protein